VLVGDGESGEGVEERDTSGGGNEGQGRGVAPRTGQGVAPRRFTTGMADRLEEEASRAGGGGGEVSTPRGNRLIWRSITGEGELAAGEGDCSGDAEIASWGEGELAAGTPRLPRGRARGSACRGRAAVMSGGAVVKPWWTPTLPPYRVVEIIVQRSVSVIPHRHI
jgi:hypothetical protein